MELICLPGRIESGDRDLGAADWLRIGSRAGQGNKQVGLAASLSCPEDCHLAVMAGILSAGADVWDYGRMSIPEFRCCVGSSKPALALMLLPPRGARVLSPEGETLFPLKRHSSRARKSGNRVSMESLKELYPIHLLRSAEDFLGMEARFTGGTALRRTLEETFVRLGGSIGGDLTVRLWEDGSRLTLSYAQNLLWEGESPDGDGPAHAIRLLSRIHAGEGAETARGLSKQAPLLPKAAFTYP